MDCLSRRATVAITSAFHYVGHRTSRSPLLCLCGAISVFLILSCGAIALSFGADFYVRAERDWKVSCVPSCLLFPAVLGGPNKSAHVVWTYYVDVLRPLPRPPVLSKRSYTQLTVRLGPTPPDSAPRLPSPPFSILLHPAPPCSPPLSIRPRPTPLSHPRTSGFRTSRRPTSSGSRRRTSSGTTRMCSGSCSSTTPPPSLPQPRAARRPASPRQTAEAVGAAAVPGAS